jgi:hypothetical protein
MTTGAGAYANLPGLPGYVVWREPLMRDELTDHDLRIIERELELQLYGYRKPEESIVGFRVLHENEEGRSDLLLLRRDLTEPGFFFDLDGTLGELGVGEVEELHQKVGQTIAMLTDPEPTGLQEPMGS